MKNYMKKLLILSLLFVITAISFNWLINPYGIFNSPEIEGINKNKPEFSIHLRLAKAAAVYEQKPEAVILGTSRSEFGFDPNHIAWKTNLVYNLALSGSNMYEVLRYFQYVHRIKYQKQVILAVDFFMFNIFRKNKPDFKESNFTPNQLLTLASIDTFFASIKTVFKQHTEEIYLDNGQQHWTLNANNIRNKGGHRQAFRSTEKKYMKKVWFQGKQYKFTNRKQSTLNYFRTLLDIAYRDNVDLRILISPSHARLWEALDSVGLWKKFEQWKREMVLINEQQAKKHKKTPFPLWDFSGYNSFTTEEVPPLDDKKTQMKWYWESSHYKKELGDYVLDRVFEYNHPDRIIPDDFGKLLQSKNIEQQLAKIRVEQQNYR
jgi:hypothetical protein